jgi:hypothetical protein
MRVPFDLYLLGTRFAMAGSALTLDEVTVAVLLVFEPPDEELLLLPHPASGASAAAARIAKNVFLKLRMRKVLLVDRGEHRQRKRVEAQD